MNSRTIKPFLVLFNLGRGMNEPNGDYMSLVAMKKNIEKYVVGEKKYL